MTFSTELDQSNAILTRMWGDVTNVPWEKHKHVRTDPSSYRKLVETAIKTLSELRPVRSCEVAYLSTKVITAAERLSQIPDFNDVGRLLEIRLQFFEACLPDPSPAILLSYLFDIRSRLSPPVAVFPYYKRLLSPPGRFQLFVRACELVLAENDETRVVKLDNLLRPFLTVVVVQTHRVGDGRPHTSKQHFLSALVRFYYILQNHRKPLRTVLPFIKEAEIELSSEKPDLWRICETVVNKIEAQGPYYPTFRTDLKKIEKQDIVSSRYNAAHIKALLPIVLQLNELMQNQEYQKARELIRVLDTSEREFLYYVALQEDMDFSVFSFILTNLNEINEWVLFKMNIYSNLDVWLIYCLSNIPNFGAFFQNFPSMLEKKIKALSISDQCGAIKLLIQLGLVDSPESAIEFLKKNKEFHQKRVTEELWSNWCIAQDCRNAVMKNYSSREINANLRILDLRGINLSIKRIIADYAVDQGHIAQETVRLTTKALRAQEKMIAREMSREGLVPLLMPKKAMKNIPPVASVLEKPYKKELLSAYHFVEVHLRENSPTEALKIIRDLKPLDRQSLSEYAFQRYFREGSARFDTLHFILRNIEEVTLFPGLSKIYRSYLENETAIEGNEFRHEFFQIIEALIVSPNLNQFLKALQKEIADCFTLHYWLGNNSEVTEERMLIGLWSLLLILGIIKEPHEAGRLCVLISVKLMSIEDIMKSTKAEGALQLLQEAVEARSPSKVLFFDFKKLDSAAI